MKPILSILIATRNRIPYCINLIDSILSFDYQNFELVIQDNSDSLELSEFVKTKINDKRLIYNYTPPPFSSIDNFNAVIGLASGEYLCVIGDDDGVTHEIFTLAEWMKKKSIDAVKPSLSLMYRWPDACEFLPRHKGDMGNLEISKFTGKIEIIEVKRELDILMDCGGQNYLMRQLPKLYHGIVARKHLLAIKEKTGNYTGGLSPDIYWVIALSKFIKKLHIIDYPVTIPGVCAEPLKSGGHLSKIDKLEDAPHFRARGHYQWSSNIPKFYCAENIWADSAFTALKENEMKYQKLSFNIRYLSGILYYKYPTYRELILSNLSKNSKSIIDKKMPRLSLAIILLKILFYKISYRTNKYLHNKDTHIIVNKEFKGISTIYNATYQIKSYFINKEISLEKLLISYDKNSIK
jgi:glycosyltransferase involved in cell wall biosynthesis